MFERYIVQNLNISFMKQKILVLGTGSAAYRHVKNILKIKGIAEINVYSNLKNRSKVFCERFNKLLNDQNYECPTCGQKL